MKKRVLSLLLCLCLAISLLPGTALAEPNDAPAETGPQSAVPLQGEDYHYRQLTDLAKTVYDGIGAMDLMSGTDRYDLVGHGLDGGNLPGSTELNQAMNAARYAYYADHPEAFYVDFPKLSLRMTQDAGGARHVYLGSGRNPSYLLEALSDRASVEAAAAELDRRVNEIAEGARKVTAEEGKSLQAAQIQYVHREIIQHASYRLEDTADVPNRALLGTPYGVLVRKQGVCEGYSRAFKTVMDRLGIRCILVQGVHWYDEVAVNHMWNAVEITDAQDASGRAGSRWYAVDATLDDPEVPVVGAAGASLEYSKYHNQFDTYGLDNFEQEKYLLAGRLTMNEKHTQNEEVAAAGDFRFTYPVLEDNDFTITDLGNDLDGFNVQIREVSDPTVGQNITEFRFNYLGMTASEARDNGIYLLWRYYEEAENGDIVPIYNDYGSWAYLDPDAYAGLERDGFVCVRENDRPYVEIAATTKKPAAGVMGLTYLGDDTGLIARTGKLYNPNQTGYKAPPYIRRQIPVQTATIDLSDRFFHITVEYDEDLVLAEGRADVTPRITCRDRGGHDVTGAKYSEIRNFLQVDPRTVSFDMRFSKMYADNSVIYSIYLDGLVGRDSRKAPNPVVYTARQPIACPCIMERNGNWDIFGKPTLLENDDLSLNDWETSTGKPVSDLLRDRLVLVSSKPSQAESERMEDMVEEQMGEKVLQSATYSIMLSVCKISMVGTGHKVKVRLGFPAGYGPEDEGVTFKAYHFSKNALGEVTGVEEIDCVVTPYGLVVTCDRFSPFLVAAVERDGSVQEPRSLVVTASDGGTVQGLDTSGLLRLNPGESRTVTYRAAPGYRLEYVTVCGRSVEAADGQVTLRYEDAQGANCIVNASFVAEAVAEAEESAGETPVVPAPECLHTEKEVRNAKPATAAEEGYTGDTYCKLCNKLLKTGQRIPRLGGSGSGNTPDRGYYDDPGSDSAYAVQVDRVSHGSVDVRPSYAEKGDTVTVTVTPDPGYALRELTVLDKNGRTVTLTRESDGAYTFRMPEGRVRLEASFEAAADPVQPPVFTDVPQGSYCYDAVLWAVERGITNGASATTFNPNGSCTRGQIVTFLWRAAGSPRATGGNPFTDVSSGAYYYDAVLWAVERGITKGASATTFDPNATVTRGQTVTFLHRANGSPATAAGSGFMDVPQDAYYADAVAWALSAGITTGTGGNAFSPNASCTRGQIVTFLYRGNR